MDRGKAFETITTLSLALLVIALWQDQTWPIYVSMALMAISISSTRVLLFIAKSWSSLSHYWGIVMNFVLMFLIFHFILLPLAILQRLFGRNQIRQKTVGMSYFNSRKHLFSSKDIDHPW